MGIVTWYWYQPAAPQVGLAIRLFVIDTAPFGEDTDLSNEEQSHLNNFKRTFINAKMIKEEGEEWGFNEGCLSIPEVREDVYRHEKITIEYCDENFNKNFIKSHYINKNLKQFNNKL